MRSQKVIRRVGAGLPLALVVLLAPLAGPREQAPRIMTWQTEVPEPGRALEAARPFSLVGVTWPASQPAPAAVRIRTSTDGTTWSPWADLHVEGGEGPDPGEGSPVDSSAPLWVGAGARFVDVRWNGHRPDGAAVRMVDPGPDPAKPRVAAAGAMTAQPSIVSRAQWGADESMRRGGPRYAPRTRVAFVHHTATSNGYAASESPAVVRAIYGFHVQGNGWDDIGYNFLVDRYGQVFEGRHGGTGRAVIGAHAAGFNTGSVGVAVIGTFNSVAPPQAAWNSVENLLAWRLDLDHVDPLSQVRMVSGGSNKYPAGTSVTLPAIAAHRDVGHTSCPGDGMYNVLPNVRNAVNGIGRPKLYDPTAAPTVFTPNGDGMADTVAGSVRPSDAGDWSLTVLDANGATVRTASGSGAAASFSWDGRNATAQLLPHGWYRFRWNLSTTAGRARTAEAPVLLGTWPQGALLKEPDRPEVYLLSGDVLRHVTSEEVFVSLAAWSDIASVHPGTLNAYRRTGQVRVREGSLVFGAGHPRPVYLVSEGKRRHVRSEADFHRLGYRWESVRNLPQTDVQALPLGEPVNPNALTRPSGSLLKGSGPAVYWVQGGTRRHVTSEAVFNSWFSWNEIAHVSDTELGLHPLGPPLGFRDGSVVHTPDRRVWVISGGQRRHVTSEATLSSLGYGWHSVRWVSASDVSANPVGSPL